MTSPAFSSADQTSSVVGCASAGRVSFSYWKRSAIGMFGSETAVALGIAAHGAPFGAAVRTDVICATDEDDPLVDVDGEAAAGAGSLVLSHRQDPRRSANATNER